MLDAGGERIRVLIVDDQVPFRRAAQAVVESTDAFAVAGTAATAEEAVVRLATDWPPVPTPEFLTDFLGDEEYTHLVRSRPQLIESAMRRLTEAYPAVDEYDEQQL